MLFRSPCVRLSLPCPLLLGYPVCERCSVFSLFSFGLDSIQSFLSVLSCAHGRAGSITNTPTVNQTINIGELKMLLQREQDDNRRLRGTITRLEQELRIMKEWQLGPHPPLLLFTLSICSVFARVPLPRVFSLSISEFLVSVCVPLSRCCFPACAYVRGISSLLVVSLIRNSAHPDARRGRIPAITLSAQPCDFNGRSTSCPHPIRICLSQCALRARTVGEGSGNTAEARAVPCRCCCCLFFCCSSRSGAECSCDCTSAFCDETVLWVCNAFLPPLSLSSPAISSLSTQTNTSVCSLEPIL